MSFFFSFFLRDIITKVWYRIIKKARDGGRCTNVVIVSLFTILARNLRLVLELFMNCVCCCCSTALFTTVLLEFSPLVPLLLKLTKHQQQHHHHHSIAIYLLLPFRVWRKNVCCQPQPAAEL